jgi:hypothetical protein
MEEIVKKLQPKKVQFTRTDGIPLPDCECPEDVKKSFSLLTKSSRYTWNDNTVQFFYMEKDCDEKFGHIATLLSLIQPRHALHADIFLSPIKKYYPTDKVFGPPNVNTGYATSEKIVVYREEEWLKVFIHECWHYFKFDALLFNPELTHRILKLFPVQSEVNIYESYCEMWARTLNCCMIAAHKNLDVGRLLQREKKHAIRHMVNVLHKMELTYHDIQVPNAYTEKTNVLAYVVLCCIVMNANYIEKNNCPFALLDVDSYMKCIEDNYRNEDLILAINHTIPQVTTTMSILSI